jgi:hypothetical protein
MYAWIINAKNVAGSQEAGSIWTFTTTTPAPVPVPNVVGLTQAAATTAITGAGLIVGTVTTASSNIVASGSVIGENPLAGTSVAVGSAVNLLVSSGPMSIGTINFISKFTGLSSLGNSAIYESNGFVGISTTQPGISLDVRTGALPQMGIAGVTDYLTFFASDVYGPAIYWDPAKDMRFGKGGAGLYNPYGFVEQMRIQSSTGNVGIGTMTPGFKLDVTGDSNFTGSIRYQANPMLQLPGGLAGANLALGIGALPNVTTGTSNIAIGHLAASLVSGGNSNNIHIGNQGVAGDSGVIRMGTPGTQSSLFTAAVRGATTGSNSAIGVVIDSNGQLGTLSSSRRFKENIQDMGALSLDLLRLRPVTFRYKQSFTDGAKPVQYGLIAEDVARVFPDLVAHSADGLIETVKYQVLGPMLLNGVQFQQAEIRRLKEEIAQQQQENESLQERLARIEAALASLSNATSNAKKSSSGQ